MVWLPGDRASPRWLGKGPTLHPRLLDAAGPRPQTVDMAKPKDLIPVDVHTEDLVDYKVTETGWYAVDDGGRVVLGPFDSLALCEQAIRDRLQSLTKSQIPPLPT